MRTRRLGLIVSCTVLFVAILVPASRAAEQVTVPTTAGQTTTLSWTGLVLPGANTGSECAQGDLAAHVQEVDIVVPPGAYDVNTVLATVELLFEGPNDMILTAVFPDGTTTSADQGFADEDESIGFSNPDPGRYTFIACMFAGAVPQSYTGRLTLEATVEAPPPVADCAAPGKPITFATPSYVDTNRAGGEPGILSHPDGTLLYASHAGTTQFFVGDPDPEEFGENYRGQVYAWTSDDLGATWRYVDRTVPPSGVPGSGFSDPDFAIDAAGNVYLSEINLVNVAMSKSSDSGHSYTLQNFFAQFMTDRQWTAAGPEDVVFIVGNEIEGGTVPTDPVGNNGHQIHRSTDGGRTFSQAVSDGGGLGDIVYDQGSSTLFEAHFEAGRLKIAAFRDPLNPDVVTALTPEEHTIAHSVDLLSHWPAIDVDSEGNVYIAWDEGGTGARPAGIYFSSSEDGGRTWAAPTRVDPDSRTDIWPWIAVGDPGRVAVSWFGNARELPEHDAEQAGPNDGWNVFVAQTLKGLGCSSAAGPGFRVSRATPEPFHTGPVCMGGTICQTQGIDRRLGDYFTIDIDVTGALVAAYSDTRQGGAVSLPAFVRQTGGPSFFRAGGSG